MSKSSFSFFYQNIDYFYQRGKGIVIFNASNDTFSSIKSALNTSHIPSKFFNSIKSLNTAEIKENDKSIYLFELNEDINLFEREIEIVINKFLFPLWFYKNVFIFLTPLSKNDFMLKKIASESVHFDLAGVENFLLKEQIISLFDRSTYQIENMDADNVEFKDLMTPVEYYFINNLKLNCVAKVKYKDDYFDFLLKRGNRNLYINIDDRFNNLSQKYDEENYSINISSSEVLEQPELLKIKINKYFKDNFKSKKYHEDIDLDNSQVIAKNFIAGPIRVLAPAGSGKTKTLVNRIINLANNGISTNKILALAFNKKAGEEMRLRLYKKGITDLEVRTFHSLGNEILKTVMKWEFDIPNQKEIHRKIIRNSIENNLKIPFKRNTDYIEIFSDIISKCKNELIPLDEFQVELEDETYPIKDVFLSSIELQAKEKFYSFDDMIYLAVRVLIKNDALRKKYQNSFEYILVDEFQDLNRSQLLFLQILSLPQNNVFIVGDDDQMIYGWRGAEVKHIINFPKKFSVAQECTLSTNYRSAKKIVNQSRWLIDKNKIRVPKNIKAREQAALGILDYLLCEDLWEQTEKSIEWIAALKEKYSLQWSEFAILFRYNAFQYPLALIMDKKQIPHTPVNYKLLFKTRVGRDLYIFMKLIFYEKEISVNELHYIIKRFTKHISNNLLEKIHSLKSLVNIDKIYEAKAWEKAKLISFRTKIGVLSILAKKKNVKPFEFLLSLEQEFSIIEFYKLNSFKGGAPDEAGDDIIFEVITAISQNYNNIYDFYSNMELSINSEIDTIDESELKKSSENEITLTTIHKTKGNEYQNAVYFNLANPSINSDEEEERRVAYVGVTRAKQNLLITASKNNFPFFLREIFSNPEFSKFKLRDLKHYLETVESNIKTLENRMILINNKISELESERDKITDLSNASSLLKDVVYRKKFKKIQENEEKIADLKKSTEQMEIEIIQKKEKAEEYKVEIQFRKSTNSE